MADDHNRRRATKQGEPTAPRIERDGIVWRVRSLSGARQVLRAREQTTQAGFTAERIPQGFFTKHPILISDGPARTVLHDAPRLARASLEAPPCVRLGSRLGVPALTVDELAGALERRSP